VAAAVAIIALLGPYLQGLGNWNLLIFFVFGVGALMLWCSRTLENSWVELLVLWLPAAFAFTVYAFVLDRVDGIALGHRENLISNLGRRE
jgi:hypothetical protein